MNEAVLATGNYNQVLWPVVERVAVDVVNALGCFKNTATRFASDESVFEHIAVPVGVWMIGLGDEHVSAPDRPAALPLMVGGSGGHLMAGDVTTEVATTVAARRLVGFGDRSGTAAATEAQAGWI